MEVGRLIHVGGRLIEVGLYIAFVDVFFKAPTPSAHEIEASYAAVFGQTQDLHLAVLVAVAVAFLIILAAVFIRALEKAKQKHDVSLVNRYGWRCCGERRAMQQQGIY